MLISLVTVIVFSAPPADPPPVALPRLAASVRFVWADWPGVGMGWVQADLVGQGVPRPMPGPPVTVVVPDPPPVPVYPVETAPAPNSTYPVRPAAAKPACYTDRYGRTVCPLQPARK